MTRKEWKAKQAERRLDAIAEKLGDRARAKRSRESKQKAVARTPQATHTRVLHIEVRAKLQTERAITRETERSRETLQDFIDKTDALWLAAALRSR